MRTLFASDVHLRPDDPVANASFLRFLREECDVLYLVGDLFDYWIGPRHLDAPDYEVELEALRRKSERTPIFFVKGNRDYLLDGRFERVSGMKVLGDRARVQIGNRSVELAHGDFLYNKNPKYTAYRTMMRSKPVEALWRAVPAGVGKRIVRGYRKVSPMTTRPVVWAPAELAGRARPVFEQGADVLICGHIHQPQHLELEVGGRRRDLFILGDWCGGTQDYVEWNGTDFRLKRWT